MARRNTPTVRMAWLGQELTFARVALNLTSHEAAQRIERSASTLSTWENGLAAPKGRDMPFICDRLEIHDEAKREQLIQLARDATKRGWWHEHVGRISQSYIDFISLEHAAREISVNAIALIPGLLQTEAYAREVVTASRLWSRPEDIEEVVSIRMARQSILRRENDPVRFWAVIDEGALRRVVGNGSIMRRQIEYIRDVAHDLPHVTVQVLPHGAGAHAGMDGPFSLLDINGLPMIACVTSLTSTLYLQSDAVEVYTTAFNHVRGNALPARRSLDFLLDILMEDKT